MLLPALFWLLPANLPAPAAGASLRVTRDGGSESCANESDLKLSVSTILRRQSWAEAGQGVRVDFDVRFERAEDGAFVAKIAARGDKEGQRQLRDQNPHCDALSQAVSVAIALLLDSAKSEHESSAPATTERKPVAVPGSSPAPDAGADRAGNGADPEGVSGRVSLGGGGGYGLGGSGTLLGEAGLGLDAGRWRFELSGSGTLPAAHEYRAGNVRTSLLFGSARGCYLVGRAFLLGPCVELGVGRLRGEGGGFEQAQPSNLVWVAGGLGLGAETPLAGRLFLRMGATLWVPTRRHSFSVQNAGIAWESKPVAGILSAALGLTLF
ncbi:MAG TPA: hypothetical protein VHB79_29960 [Polyangiaceae bacterium]|nr:hypothetical protein [Polyangiaceae bacterium]